MRKARFQPCTLTDEDRVTLKVIAEMVRAGRALFSQELLKRIIPDLTYSGLGPEQPHMDPPTPIDSPEFGEQFARAYRLAEQCSVGTRFSRTPNVWSRANELAGVTGAPVCTGALVLAFLLAGFTVSRCDMGTGGSGVNVAVGSLRRAMKMMV